MAIKVPANGATAAPDDNEPEHDADSTASTPDSSLPTDASALTLPTVPTPEDDASAESAVSDPALVTAWQRFLNFDTLAGKLKRRRTSVRRNIILLGVITSFFAVAITYANVNTDQFIIVILKLALVILPIATSLLISYAGEFTPMAAWAVYRIAAELVRREIYLYRMQAGVYVGNNDRERRKLLLHNVGKAGRLEKVYDSDAMENPSVKEAVQQVLAGNATVPQFEQIEEDVDKLKERVRRITSKWNEPAVEKTLGRKLQRSLKRLFKSDQQLADDEAKKDDGFSAMSADDYVCYRLVPQLNWYINRVEWDYTYMRHWKIAILFVGGLGSVLVAISAIFSSANIRLEPLVAVTTSAVTAMGLYIELKMYNHTYLAYSSIARRLRDLYDEWKFVLQDAVNEPQADAALYKRFVVRTERVFQAEREEWLLRVVQSQTALEQKLARSGSQETGESDAAGRGIAQSLLTLATVALHNDDFPRARTLYEESLTVAHRANDNLGMIEALEGLVVAHSALGLRSGVQIGEYATRIATLSAAAEAARFSDGQTKDSSTSAFYDRKLREFINRLPPEDREIFNDESNKAKALKLDEVVKIALAP